MNVTCPLCETVYRVDPAKVPAGGVRARCSVCSNVFAVSEDGAPPTPPSPGVPTLTQAGPRVARPAMPAMSARPVMPTVPPVARPAAPAAPARPAVRAAPVAPAPVPPPATAPASAPGKRHTGPLRPVNPFLVQDPKQKARRLARALISDMLVYHPEKRQQGIRDGTLPQLFKDEIAKSWQEYVEQVGVDTAQSTPYWTEALNEILAGGHKLF